VTACGSKGAGCAFPAIIRWVTFIAALVALGQGCLRLDGGSVSWKEGAHWMIPSRLGASAGLTEALAAALME
jgi:hypothetical protein